MDTERTGQEDATTIISQSETAATMSLFPGSEPPPTIQEALVGTATVEINFPYLAKKVLYKEATLYNFFQANIIFIPVQFCN